MKRKLSIVMSLALAVVALQLGGCSTAPKTEGDRADFIRRADSTTQWFKANVAGLDQQIKGSAGYIVFPDVAQWGILFGGGTWGRGMLYTPDGQKVGWSAINVSSVGLQAGAQGFRMMFVLQNDVVLQEFKANKWTGSVAGVAVAGEKGAAGTASFTSGVAVYQGAHSGVMAGVNIGLNNVRYKDFDPNEPAPGG